MGEIAPIGAPINNIDGLGNLIACGSLNGYNGLKSDLYAA